MATSDFIRMRDIELNNDCRLKRTFKQLRASFSLAQSGAIKGKPHVFESWAGFIIILD
jgi:hypothetical protein